MQRLSQHRAQGRIGRALTVAAALLCATALSQPNVAYAHGGGGGFHGGGGGFHGGGFHGGGFHGDRFHDGRFHGGFIGFGFYPYYDYGNYGQPYFQTWYYCADPAGYYPYVTSAISGGRRCRPVDVGAEARERADGERSGPTSARMAALDQRPIADCGWLRRARKPDRSATWATVSWATVSWKSTRPPQSASRAWMMPRVRGCSMKSTKRQRSPNLSIGTNGGLGRAALGQRLDDASTRTV